VKSLELHLFKHPEAGTGGHFKRNLRSRSKSQQPATINNNNNNTVQITTASSANQISMDVHSFREHELESRRSQRSSSRPPPLQRETIKNTVPPATTGTTQHIRPTMTTTTIIAANDNNSNAIRTNEKRHSPPRDPRPGRIQYSPSRVSPEPEGQQIEVIWPLCCKNKKVD
jgi:hypothetical protein